MSSADTAFGSLFHANKKRSMKKVTLILLFVTSVVTLNAQEQKSSPEISLLFGLNQPIATQGFNFEVNYWMEKIVIDYSHGFGLKFRDGLVSSEASRQRIAFNITNSLGIGIGYRFTDRFNLRVEPKWHVWEIYYDDAFKTSEGKITTYNTFTLGLGAYYRWNPFEKRGNALKGLTIVPSIRWWPNVATSLDNNEYEYFNTRTGQAETHKANSIGIANSPFFVNVSVGWTIGLGKRG
jgi:hypothetical protein